MLGKPADHRFGEIPFQGLVFTDSFPYQGRGQPIKGGVCRHIQGLSPGIVGAVLGIALGVAMIFYQGSILVALVAIYLIVFPLIRVLMANKKSEQLKRELLRIVLGVLLLVFVPNWTEAISNVLQILFFICGGAVIVLSLAFGIIEIVRIATAKEIKAPENGHIYVDFEEKKD